MSAQSINSVDFVPVAIPADPRFKDLTGLVFGYWVVLGYLGKVGRAATWLCCCKCGQKRQVIGSNMKRGGSLSCGCMDFSIPLEKRFFAKIDKEGPIPSCCPELGACWLWKGGKNKKGYGGVGTVDGKKMATHRVAYILAFGEVPEGLHVLHHCDNPTCVNPGHLFLGTNLDNTLDRIKKGRTTALPYERRLRGEKCSWSKMTGELAASIRQRVADGERQSSVAGSLGLSRSLICNVVNMKAWR